MNTIFQLELCHSEVRQIWYLLEDVEYILFIVQHYFDLTTKKKIYLLEQTQLIADDNFIVKRRINSTSYDNIAFYYLVQRFSVTLHNVLLRSIKGTSHTHGDSLPEIKT